MRQGISLHRILSFQYSSTFVQWLIKELLNIILAWQYHLVAGLGTEVLTQGRLPLPVPALGLAVPRGRHRPDKRSKLISTTINVNRINQSFKCAIKIIRVDTWNLNVSSFSFTSSTCWYDKEDQHRIYLRPPHTLVFVILCLYLRIPGGDESGQGQGEADPRCCHPPGHYVSVWISGLRPTPGKTPNNSQFEDDFPNQSWQRCYHPVCPPVPEIVQWHNRWEYGIFRKMDDGSSNVAQPSPAQAASQLCDELCASIGHMPPNIGPRCGPRINDILISEHRAKSWSSVKTWACQIIQFSPGWPEARLERAEAMSWDSDMRHQNYILCNDVTGCYVTPFHRSGINWPPLTIWIFIIR